MNKKQKTRINLLSTTEIDELYSIPIFNKKDRELFFALSNSDYKLLDEYRTHLSNKYDLMKNDIYLNDTDEFQNIMKNIFEIYEIQAKTMSENTIKQIIKDLAPQLRYIKQNDKQDNTNSTNSTNSDESDDE